MSTFGWIFTKCMNNGDNVLFGRNIGLRFLLLDTTFDYKYSKYVFFHWMWPQIIGSYKVAHHNSMELKQWYHIAFKTIIPWLVNHRPQLSICSLPYSQYLVAVIWGKICIVIWEIIFLKYILLIGIFWEQANQISRPKPKSY